MSINASTAAGRITEPSNFSMAGSRRICTHGPHRRPNKAQAAGAVTSEEAGP
jgi:hypothetical protein